LARHSYAPALKSLRGKAQSHRVARTFAKTHGGVFGYEAAPSLDLLITKKRQPKRGFTKGRKRHIVDSKRVSIPLMNSRVSLPSTGLVYNYP
jgi:hypothetical protein